TKPILKCHRSSDSSPAMASFEPRPLPPMLRFDLGFGCESFNWRETALPQPQRFANGWSNTTTNRKTWQIRSRISKQAREAAPSLCRECVQGVRFLWRHPGEGLSRTTGKPPTGLDDGGIRFTGTDPRQNGGIRPIQP